MYGIHRDFITAQGGTAHGAMRATAFPSGTSKAKFPPPLAKFGGPIWEGQVHKPPLSMNGASEACACPGDQPVRESARRLNANIGDIKGSHKQPTGETAD